MKDESAAYLEFLHEEVNPHWLILNVMAADRCFNRPKNLQPVKRKRDWKRKTF